MSNKTDLQALNAKYDSLIETLKGKAVNGENNTNNSVKIATGEVEYDGMEFGVYDLPFTPKQVILFLKPTTDIVLSSSTAGMDECLLLSCYFEHEGQNLSTEIFATKNKTNYSVGSCEYNSMIDIIENGFNIIPMMSYDDNINTGKKYIYIAIG